MLCGNCGSEHGSKAVFCSKCGIALNSVNAHLQQHNYSHQSNPSFNAGGGDKLIHWVPLFILIITFITFGVLGGDAGFYEAGVYEVNTWDFVSIPLSIAGLLSTIFLIPGNRKVMKTILLILNGFMAISTLGYVLAFM